jgi:lantibiotic biosynthesis dehydratase-like protein
VSGTDGLVLLPGTDWAFWRQAELRTAGFPATLVRALADPDLHELAHRPDASYAVAFAESERARSAVLRSLAAEPRLREAVAWQNASVLTRCLDKIAAGDRVKPSVRRKRELTLASYLQRYAMKNDTIGFFGPVGFARFRDDAPAMRITHGRDLTATRNVHCEHWAIDALAAAVVALPGIRPWLTPVRTAAHTMAGDVVVRPTGPDIQVTERARRVLLCCDGRTPVYRIAELIGSTVDEELTWLLDQGLVEPGLAPSHGLAPDRALRERLLAIGDPAVRDRALAVVDDVLTARDAVSAVAGDADKVARALEELDRRFERLTGTAAHRRPGEPYAGRSLVFEDTVRDMAVELGPDLLARLARPLGLVLDSARWFVGDAAARYRARFTAVFTALAARLGTDTVPFHRFFSAVVPDLMSVPGNDPAPVAAAVAELRARWAELLAAPRGVREYRVRAADLAVRAGELFPATPPPWSSAVHHCPDIMVAAPDVAAIAAGRARFVLGELHVASNTLDCQVIAAQHPDPEALIARDVADRRTPRVLPVPAKDSPTVNSRTYPPVLVDASQVFWTAHANTTGAPGTVHAATAMTVRRSGPDLVVTTGELRLDLMEVLGEYLSAAVMSAFSPVATTHHRPRILVDDLVLSREAWHRPAAELDWTGVVDRAERYRRATAWRVAEGLPVRAFYRVVVENKPLYVDFASPVLVDLFASTIRRATDDDPDAWIWLSELLPELDEQWVHDANGAAYSAELRVVAVDRAGSYPAALDRNQSHNDNRRQL